MVIFHSYVSLPEGIFLGIVHDYHDCTDTGMPLKNQDALTHWDL
jgi:hypothetical protein